ncbi:MAG: S-adenosyl-l-methionine hydroxide adenosyltransferase family protein [Acidobacteriia bacterium]|nr:S-adenosyl-l-methionine hydroxide adenosyltransferase family protein [Terriglobia bacterium]
MPHAILQRLPRRLIVIVLVLGVAAPVIAAAHDAPSPRPTIVFMTDFGVVDDSVAICKGVMYSIVPDLRIVDLTHQVTPFSILDGARFLYGATPYYPAGTVFVVVIDPGVGSTRRAVVVKSKRGQYFVLPDNGLMTLVQDRDGLEAAREITNPAWMIGAALSSTFHGRDIFSPAGAHLARGDDWTQVGPAVEVDKLVRLDLAPAKLDAHGLSGEVIATDGPFGNLVTNISGDDFLKLGYAREQTVPVTIGKKSMTLPFVRTFSDVPLKKPLVYIDSRGRLGFAVNQGSFSAIYGIKPPQPVVILRPRISARRSTQ